MATVNAYNITLGAPEQSTTGAVLSAPSGTALPTSAVDALNAAFESSGFVTEDGVNIEYDQTKTTLRDWSAKARRTIIENTEAKVTFALMEISEEGLVQAFGSAAVTKVAATSAHGTQLNVAITGDLPDPRIWCFNMKDGDRRVRLVIPNGQVTALPNMTFTAGDAITIPIEITGYPDANGQVAIFMNDDGLTV